MRFSAHKKGYTYVFYLGEEYRLNKKRASFTRYDGLLISPSNRLYKYIHSAMSGCVTKRDTAQTNNYRQDKKRASKETISTPCNASVIRSNELSWANHILTVRETKTRETKSGHRVYVGNLLIIVPDKNKIESVRKRFENHESNKFKR